MEKNYYTVAPDTANWNKLVTKMYTMMGSWKGFDSLDIKKIKAPTLLIFGDADISKPEHAVEMVDQTDVLMPMVIKFLSVKS